VGWLQEIIYFILFFDKVKTLSLSQYSYLSPFAQPTWEIGHNLRVEQKSLMAESAKKRDGETSWF